MVVVTMARSVSQKTFELEKLAISISFQTDVRLTGLSKATSKLITTFLSLMVQSIIFLIKQFGCPPIAKPWLRLAGD